MTDPARTLASDSDGSPEVLAFYLPQFHQVPENDAWHGPGFTEWSTVARSKPLYPGHRQPELPGELGFYDLRVPETRYRQAKLAREHGITGFLYYHYWFGGRRMLGRPFDEVLSLGQPDFPFALCWANESWYRRWQGIVDEMLLEQVYSEEDDIAHIRWLIECFKDPRYIRIDGHPLFAVYRPHFLPDALRTVELWRAECERAGMEHPWLVMFETEPEPSDPKRRGFDASAEFLPHNLGHVLPTEAFEFDGNYLYAYEDVAHAYLDRPPAPWRRYPCVATGWDNTPRRQAGDALILVDPTPRVYGRWLSGAVTRQREAAGTAGIVFVNAWNEWAEGAHLEPDEHWGRAFLEATREVLQDFGRVPDVGKGTEADVAAHSASPEDLYHDLYAQFVALQQSASGFVAYTDRRISELKTYYEARIAWANHKGDQITGLNEWLFEQLRFQDERMRSLGVPDAGPITNWLDDPARAFGLDEEVEQEGGGAEGRRDEPLPGWRTGEVSDGAAAGSRPAQSGEEDPAAADEVDVVASVAHEVDEGTRDDGYDDLPEMPRPTPEWLLERDSSG